MHNLSVKYWREQVCVHCECQSSSNGVMASGKWCVWALVLVFTFLVCSVSVFGVTLGLLLMGSFSAGEDIRGLKCRFLSLTFLSDWQTKLIHAGKESLIFICLWLIFWKRMVSHLKWCWPKKRIFSIAPLDCFSPFGEHYSLRALLKIFVLLVIWHLETAFNSKLCHKLRRWVFEKHLVSCSAFRVFKPMQFLSASEVNEHFFS